MKPEYIIIYLRICVLAGTIAAGRGTSYTLLLSTLSHIEPTLFSALVRLNHSSPDDKR